jgi:hypothetical protein
MCPPFTSHGASIRQPFGAAQREARARRREAPLSEGGAAAPAATSPLPSQAEGEAAYAAALAEIKRLKAEGGAPEVSSMVAPA